MIIEYSRVRPDAKPPTRANPSDAGLDLFFNPDSIEAGVRLKPGESKLFQTGIRVGVPHGYMLEIKNRSSVASKRSLLVGACVVDSGYDGEIFVNLHNVGTEEQIVARHDKIAQAVMVPVVHFRALETHSGDLYNWHPITISNRGTGALGSTDES
jgi:dUTP pyrophosphatase